MHFYLHGTDIVLPWAHQMQYSNEKKRMEILFWRHQTSSQRKKGQYTIYCRVTVGGEREDLGSTNMKTYYDFFNPDRERVESNSPHYTEKYPDN